jgi:malonate decarboxylase alpha subunit
MVAASDATALMPAVIEPGDRLCLEGNNQKQADFLAAARSKVDPAVVRGLHIVQSTIPGRATKIGKADDLSFPIAIQPFVR